MVKTVITPRKNIYSLPIPAHYIGKTLEVLLYSSDEFLENKAPSDKKPSDFFSTLDLSEGQKFQDYVANARLEWNRNI
ncbi:MAG: hypothetical protein FWE30_01065 [Bacteroidales bacterium]|nr:hypothetical protein [Bacteroidales bacterium]MCL2738019.1 hypothetical protein [Bacteroidales bacterium]